MKKETFVTSVVEELKKVSWPTREQTIRNTIIVALISVIVGLYAGVIDVGLAKLLQQITK